MNRIGPREHMLLRPEMYIGSVLPVHSVRLLANQKGELYEAESNIIPALNRIFEDILINAYSNRIHT